MLLENIRTITITLITRTCCGSLIKKSKFYYIKLFFIDNIYLLTYNNKRRSTIYASIIAAFQMHASNFEIKVANVRSKIIL